MFKHRPEEIEYLQAQCKLFISICVWKLHSTNRPIFCVNLPTNGFSSLAKRFISSGKWIAASSYSVRKCTFEQTQTDTKTNSSAYFFFRCLCAFVFPACVCVVCNCLVSKLQNCFVYYPWHNNAKWVCEGKPNEQIRVHKRRCARIPSKIALTKWTKNRALTNTQTHLYHEQLPENCFFFRKHQEKRLFSGGFIPCRITESIEKFAYWVLSISHGVHFELLFAYKIIYIYWIMAPPSMTWFLPTKYGIVDILEETFSTRYSKLCITLLYFWYNRSKLKLLASRNSGLYLFYTIV